MSNVTAKAPQTAVEYALEQVATHVGYGHVTSQDHAARIAGRALGLWFWESVNRCGTGGRDLALDNAIYHGVLVGIAIERKRILEAVEEHDIKDMTQRFLAAQFEEELNAQYKS